MRNYLFDLKLKQITILYLVLSIFCARVSNKEARIGSFLDHHFMNTFGLISQELSRFESNTTSTWPTNQIIQPNRHSVSF